MTDGGGCQANTPGRMIVHGAVLRTDDGQESFFVAPMQHIMTMPFPAPSIVMAVVVLRETSQLPYQHLPPLNMDIFFTGEILTFKHGSLVVAVDFHMPFPLTDWIQDDGDIGLWRTEVHFTGKGSS
jgi:hypothetical protein